jgi:hypothetical protein
MYIGDSTSEPVFSVGNDECPIDAAIADTYRRIDAARATEADALRVLLNARREVQAVHDTDIIPALAYSHTVRDDEDDSPSVDALMQTRVPLRAATAPNGAWLYLLPTSGHYTVRGHGEVTVIQLHTTPTDYSTSVIVRGGLAVAYLRTRRERTYASLRPMIGSWHHSVSVEWIEVDMPDADRRAIRGNRRRGATRRRKVALDKAVTRLLNGGSLQYRPGVNGGRILWSHDVDHSGYYGTYEDIHLSGNAVLRACRVSDEDAATARARAESSAGTSHYCTLRLPVPFDDGAMVLPCLGVVPQLHVRAARLPARDRRRAVTEWDAIAAG